LVVAIIYCSDYCQLFIIIWSIFINFIQHVLVVKCLVLWWLYSLHDTIINTPSELFLSKGLAWWRLVIKLSKINFICLNFCDVCNAIRCHELSPIHIILSLII
jgi:hypothetical protein